MSGKNKKEFSTLEIIVLITALTNLITSITTLITKLK